MQGILRVALMSMTPALALGAGPFDGTWKTLPETYKVSGRPQEYEINAGLYRCLSCVPPVSAKADGTDQRVTGHDYYDSVATRVINDHALEWTLKKGGKIVNTDAVSVSADGKTLTEDWVDYTGAQPAKGTSVSTRLGSGPTGAHAVSGQWQQDSFSNGSDSLMIVKYQVTDEAATMEWNGQSYHAKFDGKEYPLKNDPANTTVTLRRVDATTIEETDHRGGKVTDVTVTKVSPDGKSLFVTDTDPVHHQKTTFTLAKQP